MRPWLNKATVLAAALGGLWAATAAGADRIVTQKGIGYSGTITGLSPQGLVIESGGTKRAVPLCDVGRVKADKYPDLELADAALAEGLADKPQKLAEAQKLYRGLLSGSGVPAWLRVLVQSRMFAIHAQAGRAPEALDAYLELARAEPQLVVGLKLPTPMGANHAANQAMLAKVNAVLANAAGKPYATELQGFRASLLMLEGKPEEVLPLLAALLQSPDEKTRQTAMIKQVELLLATGKIDEAAKRLEEAAPALGEAYAAEVAFFRGRVLKEQNQPMDAALAFMRVAILYPGKDHNRTAEALWYAGQCMEEAKASKDEVLKVYQEAVTKYAGTPGARRAKAEITRLGAK